MDFYVYILKNKVTGKVYKGQTQNLKKRMAEHSWSHTKSTSNNSKEWELVYFEIVNSREQAIIREKYFKSAAGRKFLKNKMELSSLTDTRPNVPFGTGGE
jgi:putative endonuclease